MKNDQGKETRAEGVDVLPEVRAAVHVDAVPSDILPRGEEGGLVPQVRSGVGEGTPKTWPEKVKIAEKQYNVMARVWNSLPGERLVYPKDKFRIRYHHEDYCPTPIRGHKKGDLVQDLLPLRVCYNCGYPYKGEYD